MPPKHHSNIARRRGFSQCGRSANTARILNAAASAQLEFSATCALFAVVSTAYQEQISAVAMIGTTIRDTVRANILSAAVAVAYNRKAHWAAKANSAMVATLLPTTTSDSPMSNRHSRGMSYTGTTER